MKKVLSTVALTFLTFSVFSQNESAIIDRKLRFGFNVGANYSILQSVETLPQNAEVYNGVGAKLGVFMDYSLSKNFSFSPKTEIAFNNSGVEKRNIDNSVSTYRVFPISIDIMTHFVYKIGEGGNTVPYILLGPNLRLPVGNRSRTSAQFGNRSDLAIDFGIGLENRFKDFVFAPEIRYSMGLLNVNENPTYQTLKYQNISLVLNFK